MVGSEIKDEAGKVEFSRVTKDLDSHPQESGTSFAVSTEGLNRLGAGGAWTRLVPLKGACG